MPRPRDPKIDRITVSPYSQIGFAVLIKRKNGLAIWHTRIQSQHFLSTRVSEADGKQGRALVKQILRERIEAHLRGKAKVEPASVVSVFGKLVIEYERLVVEKKDGRETPRGKRKRQVLRAARAHYLPDATIELDTTAIRQEIIRRNESSPLALSSRKRYLIALKGMFDYAVESRYLSENPIQARMVPAADSEKIGRYTSEQMTTIWNYIAANAWLDEQVPPLKRTDWQQLRLVLKLQSLIGARIEEVLSIPRDRISDVEMFIPGKRDSKGKVRWRSFPLVILPKLRTRAKRDPVARLRLQWLEEIHATLQEALARRAPRSGNLFSFDGSSIRWHLENIRKANGWPSDRRNTHSIRKWAIWYFEEVLRFPERVEEALAGHSRQVKERHYVAGRTALENAKAITLDTQ